jgi:hypothetical protein
VIPEPLGAGPDGRPGVDRVVGDDYPPSGDPAGHAGKAISRPQAQSAVRGQERRAEHVSDGLSQERAPFEGAADRVRLVLAQAVSQLADVRPQQGGAEEQRVKIQPDVPVKPGAQVEVTAPGPGKPGDRVVHHAMVGQAARPPQVRLGDEIGAVLFPAVARISSVMPAGRQGRSRPA